jgi:hypothetical protein
MARYVKPVVVALLVALLLGVAVFYEQAQVISVEGQRSVTTYTNGRSEISIYAIPQSALTDYSEAIGERDGKYYYRLNNPTYSFGRIMSLLLAACVLGVGIGKFGFKQVLQFVGIWVIAGLLYIGWYKDNYLIGDGPVHLEWLYEVAFLSLLVMLIAVIVGIINFVADLKPLWVRE